MYQGWLNFFQVKGRYGQRGEMKRNYKDDGSSTAGQLGKTTEVDNIVVLRQLS